MSEAKAKKGLFEWLRGTPAAPESRDPTGPRGPKGADDSARLDAKRPESALEMRLKDEGEIARGGMGSIRKVFDGNLMRRVAMKVLDPEVADDKVEVQRFIEEAQITGQLEHPNIPPVHELSVDGDTHFFTMKLVHGITLEKVLIEEGFNPSSEEHLSRALKILIKVCEALAFAHSRGVVHLDLKPANIMVGSFGQVYLMDWGIARIMGQSRSGLKALNRVELKRKGPLDKEGRVLGTLAYMAPEQADGKISKLDERTDVFSVGAILYRILAGRAPHVGKNAEEKWDAALACHIVPVEEAAKVQVPRKLAQVAMKALSKEPADRYASISELQEELDNFMRGPGRFPTFRYEAGATIVTEGGEGDAAYVVMSGQCQAFKMVHGTKQVLRSMGPGAVFGETAILTSGPRTASVEALEPTSVMIISRANLENDLSQSSWLGPIVRALAARFREADARATTLAEEGRTRALEAALLWRLAAQGQGEPRQCAWADLAPALAKQLGRSPEALLEEVKALACVKVDGDMVQLLPPPGAPADAASSGPK